LVTHSWDGLESLWLSYNSFGPKAVTHIANHKWPKLISLHLSGNLLYDEGVKNLV
jgi:hypothetical protein